MVAPSLNVIPLEAVRVAAPCHADWNAMTGDSRTRFCGSCEKHVYNLSGMPRPEAEDLIRLHEGNLCVRFARRADGTVVAGDCPVGLQAMRASHIRPVRWTGAVLMMVLMPFITVAGAAVLKISATQRGGASYSPGIPWRQVQPFRAMQDVQPVKAILDKVDPLPMMMGAIAMPAPPMPAPLTPGAIPAPAE